MSVATSNPCTSRDCASAPSAAFGFAALAAPSASSFEERLEEHKLRLPADYRPQTDMYFLRALEVLKFHGINPFIRMQNSVRKGPGTACGVEAALAVYEKYSDYRKNGGAVRILPEGSSYDPKETLMFVDGRVQDLVALETMALGEIAEGTTLANEDMLEVDLGEVEDNARQIRELIGSRGLIYMGARHWGWRHDAAIARAAILGGADKTSTDAGSAFLGQRGVGTIPHVLENVFAWLYGKDRAVLESTLAFDRAMPAGIPRIALVDYNNREVEDSLAVAGALYSKLQGNVGVRIDTCGENLCQGAFEDVSQVPVDHPLQKVIPLIPADELKYWFGRGVTVSGAYVVRTALNANGYPLMQQILSSGFANPKKVQAFVHAEELLGMRLFDTIGAGELWGTCRSAKSECVAIADTREGLDTNLISKAGRGLNPSERLVDPFDEE